MSLKKISCLCVALLLLVGMSSHVDAAANPQGVRLRIDHPANDAWAGIGDSVVVTVQFLPGTAALDSVWVAITEDTSATTVTALQAGLTNDTADDFVEGHGAKPKSADTDGFQSFTSTFKVTAGQTVESSSKSLVFTALVSTDSGASYSAVNNQNPEDTIDGVSTFLAVGDFKKIGIDAQRPSASIDSVRLDTTGISNFPTDGGGNNVSGDPKKAFKKNSKVKISFFVQNVPSGATGIVHIVDTANVGAAADSSMGQIDFAFSQLVSGSATDSTSISLDPGTNTKIKGDNRRIVAVSFLKDAAGNLSSTGASDVNPVGITDKNMHVVDINVPTITPLIPKSGAADSIYFTGVVDTSLNIVPLAGGAAAATTYSASPLRFTTSEGVTAASATFNDSTFTLATASTALVTGNSFTSNFATNFGVSDQGGKSGDLKISVTDSVGNKTDNTQATVTYDQKAPGLKSGSLFPTSADAPPDVDNSNEPTVNRDTMMPIFQLLEKTDSLAAQYVEVTAGTASSAKQELASGDPLLAITDAEIQVIFVDTLRSNRDYSLQMLFRDVAGNHNATAPDTLQFDAAFKNPVADSFVVSSSDKIVIAGQALILDITGIDTALTKSSGSNRAAVTHAGAATLSLEAGDQDISSVTFSGTGVTDNGDGTATLSSDGWSLATRSVKVTSTSSLDAFVARVTDSNGTTPFDGALGSLQVDAGNFASYNVDVVTDGTDDSATGVSGNFSVMVTPADRWGNPSTKTFQAVGAAVASRTDSTNLGDAKVDSSKVLGEVFVTFSSNKGFVSVPQGPQAVNHAGSTFMIGGANESGSGLYITVTTVGASGDTIGTAGNSGDDHTKASGMSAALTYAAEGEAPPVDSGALAAPANLIVQDWRGSNGEGDQGGFVLASWPGVSGADRYRIFRSIKVSSGMDDNGNVVILDDPVDKWVPWTVVDAIPAPADNPDNTIQRAVVPTLDNESTPWAVASEAGGGSSERTASSTKRVFTKQIVQNMVQFMGVDPNRVLSMTELAQVFTPAEDFAKSILGDRTDVTVAVVDPDLAVMLGGTSIIPQNIRTQSGGVTVSARTETEGPVAAVDNIPPAGVTNLANTVDGGVPTLTWAKSVDDKVVAYSTYRGYAVPIAGVNTYDIYRGESADALTMIASVPGGVTTFTDLSDLTGLSNVIYRVDAADLDNAPEGMTLDVSLGGRPDWRDADGNSVFLIDTADNTADFGDFILFASAFNTNVGEPGFLVNADTDDDGNVGFADFLNFAGTFNQTAVTINGNPIGATKPVIRRPGLNDNVELSLKLTSEKVLVGQTVTLNVAVDNAASLQGFGFDLSYDTDKFEFVEATPAQEDLLKTGGAETPVFLKQEKTLGEITVANAVVDGSPITGAGDVVSLTFRVLTEFEDNARFEIANGVVFDGSQLANPVVALGSLSVESTPTEFALLQNFPNPFNPETTIKYNVAEGANVSLRIYNVVGQVVRTLVAEQQNAGRYTVRWNGADDRGVSVSSGIYFYQISAGDFSDVKKLMLLK